MLVEALVAGLARFHRGPRSERKAWETGIYCVIVAGPSGAGKTTLVNIIRRSALCERGDVDVPRRFITRPKRQNDDLDENVHVTPFQFDGKVARGEIEHAWKRRYSPRRTERYGFARSGPKTIVLYSGNDALCESSLVEADGELGACLIIGIVAPHRVRLKRYSNRNPMLLSDTEEMDHRFGMSSRRDLAAYHVVIDNSEAPLAELETSALIFFERILAYDRRVSPQPI